MGCIWTAHHLHSRKQQDTWATWMWNQPQLVSGRSWLQKQKLYLCNYNPSALHSIGSHINQSVQKKITFSFMYFFTSIFSSLISLSMTLLLTKLLNHDWAQCFQVLLLSTLYCCACTHTVYVWHVSMLKIYIIVHRLWLGDNSANVGVMAHSLSRVE